MPIGHEHGHFAEFRFDPDLPISIARPSDLNAGRLCIVRYDFSMSEPDKAVDERPLGIWRYVHAVFRDDMQGGIRWCGRMPVELHVDATRPLDDRVSSDWIVEWTDENIRASCPSSTDRGIHVGHKI